MITKQLQFVLFPAHNRLFYQHFMNRRSVQAVIQGSIKLLGGVDKPAARTSKGIRRADHQREARFLCDLFSFQERFGGTPLANPDTQLQHFLTEKLAVFGGFYGFDIYANDLHIVFFPDTGFITINGQVQCGLTAHSG
ncbi:hypothetical protein D9M69_556700 [compost metagenome]